MEECPGNPAWQPRLLAGRWATRMAHIVINTIVTPRQLIGVGRYIRCLVDAFRTMDCDHRYTLLLARGMREWLAPYQMRVSARVLPVPCRPSYLEVLWHPIVVRILRQCGADVYHVPNTMPLQNTPCAAVVSIHDLQEFRIRRYSIGRTLYRRIVSRLAARRATRIITMSLHSKRDIVQLLRVAPEKVAVIPEGVEARFFEPVDHTQDLAVLGRLGVVAPYLLTVGEIHPGKNIGTLVRAFSRICRDVPHTLVVVGKLGWRGQRILREIAVSPVSARVRLLGYVDEGTLLALYRRAEALVFPSLYEGFGLPILEAMAVGVPVISSNASSLPEVAEDAAVLVEPVEEALAEAMLQLIRDPALRAELRARGATRARQFSWHETARSTLRVYEEAIQCYRREM